MTPTLEVFDDEDELARASIALRSRFRVALAGGTTPERLYRHLAMAENVTRVPWPRTFAFFGDERLVPHDSTDSNYRLAFDALLNHVPIPQAQVFPVPTVNLTPEEAAEAYEKTLRVQLGEQPIFDLILLGMGSDGHTASLFPGQPTLLEKTAWCLGTQPGELPPPVPRVTLTFPVLNAARHVLMLVTGAKKRPMMQTWLAGEGSLSSLPASGLSPTSGTLTIYGDRSAAGDRRDESREDDDGSAAA
jgi:6-phosphogluconolactonase